MANENDEFVSTTEGEEDKEQWLNFVVTSTSIDTTNLRLPTLEEIQRLSYEQIEAATYPFLKEKEEMQKEATDLLRWVSIEIHPAACRFSTTTSYDLNNKTIAELKEMILELRCLQHVTKEHRGYYSNNGR